MQFVAKLVNQLRAAKLNDPGPADTLHRQLLESVPTVREALLSANPLDEKCQEELEVRFFYSIKLRNGIRKYTYPRRLDDLNDLVNTLLPHHRPLKVMDVAASSGINTLEWSNSLRQAGIDAHMMAGDLNVNTFLVSIGKRLHVLVDGAGYPLQFEIFGKAIQNPPGRRKGALYCLPMSLIKMALFMRFSTERKNCLDADRQRPGKYGITCRAVALVSAKLQRTSGPVVIEDDILSNEGLRNQFHVLRAANILNRQYFDDSTLRAMLINVSNRLTRGGLLIVCLTNERGHNDATVFRLNDSGGFDVVARLGRGSEIEDLVLGCERACHKESLRTQLDSGSK
jgi:hypothetical protein